MRIQPHDQGHSPPISFQEKGHACHSHSYRPCQYGNDQELITAPKARELKFTRMTLNGGEG